MQKNHNLGHMKWIAVLHVPAILVTCGTLGLSTAIVKLIGADGSEHVACSVGTGPVDLAYKAVDLIIKEPVTLVEYSMNAVTEGIDAIVTTRVLIREEKKHLSTHALTGEVVHRTFRDGYCCFQCQGLYRALNKMLAFKEQYPPKAPIERTPVSA